MRAMLTAITIGSALSIAASAPAQERDWHALRVNGGRATLRSLGIDDSRDRATAMIEIIRRLHFAAMPPLQLHAALRAIPTDAPESITVPLPMSPRTWQRVVFERPVPEARLFAEILGDPGARLLFHGLAGLDAQTRQWFESEPGLLRALYRQTDALQAFAMFAPAIVVERARVIVPGGERAARQWGEVLDARADQPARFVSRLFLHREGRAAGLYFLIASVDPVRQRFMLDGRFASLVSSLSACYPRQSNNYPFAVRANDPALLLLHMQLAEDGGPAGPRAQRFWQSVLDVDDLSLPDPPGVAGDLDAAWLVDRVCAASSVDRAAVFGTLLAGQRVYHDLPSRQLPEAAVALRVRRRFPALFMAMEHAGVHQPAAVATVGRHAQLLDRLNDQQSTPVALQQFQGAVAMVLGVARAGTLTIGETTRLLASLSAVPIAEGRYDGRLAAWIAGELVPALRAAIPASTDLSIDALVARALGGPPAARPIPVEWEGLAYVVDHPATRRDRLLAVRQRQGGETLDGALTGARSASTGAGVRAADAVLGAVLASWAYTPHLGEHDSRVLLGGDPSRRHDLGIRDVNRTRFEQRWALARTSGDRGAIAGSYLGLDAALAVWSLRRLSADTIPLPPTLGDNDRSSLLAIVALADPMRLSDSDLHRIAAAIAGGDRDLEAARADAGRLEQLAAMGAISPWRRQAIRWMLDEEPDRIVDQFSLTARARMGGLVLDRAAAWGTSAIPLGCLCLAWPQGFPELFIGRPIDGMVGTYSADLMLRIAQLLADLEMPAQLAPAVLAYAMRDYLDGVRPMHPADVDAFSRQAARLTRIEVEDYLGAIAAVGPLRPVGQ